MKKQENITDFGDLTTRKDRMEGEPILGTVLAFVCFFFALFAIAFILTLFFNSLEENIAMYNSLPFNQQL